MRAHVCPFQSCSRKFLDRISSRHAIEQHWLLRRFPFTSKRFSCQLTNECYLRAVRTKGRRSANGSGNYLGQLQGYPRTGQKRYEREGNFEGELDGRLMYLSLQIVNFAADSFELRVVVTLERLVALALKLLYLSFDVGFIEPYYVVVFMHLNPQYVAESGDEMVFVHDTVTFQRLMIDFLSDLSKLCYRLSL